MPLKNYLRLNGGILGFYLQKIQFTANFMARLNKHTAPVVFTVMLIYGFMYARDEGVFCGSYCVN